MTKEYESQTEPHLPACTIELRKLAKSFAWNIKVRDESDDLALDRINAIHDKMNDVYGEKEDKP